MPRVEKRVARKDYPQSGIVKGDTYYYTKLKLQRGGIVKRSKTPFKQSQLTNSPFKSGWFSANEAWDESDRCSSDLTEAAGAIRELGEEAQGNFDNMPEGLQQGDTGQNLENRASECERIADALDELATEFDDLVDPDPVDEPDDDADEDQQELYDEYQIALEEYENEVERIRGEADDLFSEMPE